MFSKKPDQKNVPLVSDLPLKINDDDIYTMDKDLYMEIERTLSIDPPSDPLSELSDSRSDSLRKLYADVKRSNLFHFYFNNRSVPRICFPKTDDEKENEKAFNQFSKFLSSTLGEQAKETLTKQYEQGKIAGITSDILNAGFAKNELISTSKNKECFIHFTTESTDPSTVLVINQVKDCTYIKKKDIDNDISKKNTLYGTLETRLKLCPPDNIEVTSISSNALSILSIVLTKHFETNAPLLDRCSRLVEQCDNQMERYKNNPLELTYSKIKNNIINTALHFLEKPDARKITPYEQILKDLNNPLYLRKFNKFQEELIQTKQKLIGFKASIDEYITPETQAEYKPFHQIAEKIEANITKLQYSFPPDFKQHFDTLKEIETKLLYTTKALTPTSTHPRSALK